MISPCKPQRSLSTTLRGLVLLVPLVATGCQVDIGGQTHPSPYWQQTDIHYAAPGPAFKLAREAAALQEQAAEQVSEPQR